MCHVWTHALQQTKCMVQCFIAIPISVQLLIEFVPTLAGVGVLWDLSTGLLQLGAVKTAAKWLFLSGGEYRANRALGRRATGCEHFDRSGRHERPRESRAFQ
jgi:hypothetical protein